LKLLRACVLNFERLDIWRYSIGHPSKNYCRLNLLQTSIFNLKHLNILRDSIRHPKKKFCRLNLVRASVLNLERLEILWDSIGHPCIKLLSFEFATSFHFQFRASRYITGLNRTSEYKVIFVWKCSELLISILSVLIYYGTQSDIRVKSYCRLNLLRTSIFNFECLDILRDSVGHPSKTLLSFEFSTSFHFQFGASRYVTGLNRVEAKLHGECDSKVFWW